MILNLDKSLDRVHLNRDLYNLLDILEREGPEDPKDSHEIQEYIKAVKQATEYGMKSLFFKNFPEDKKGGGGKSQKTDADTSMGDGRSGSGGGEFILIGGLTCVYLS
jgi:hypothetical protein